MSTSEADPLAQRIGAAMRALRKGAGLSQIEVARRIGRKDSGSIGIGRNERGLQVPRADKLIAFLKAVGATLIDLQIHIDEADPGSVRSERASRLTCELDRLADRRSS